MPLINIHITAPSHPRDQDLLALDVSSDLSIDDLKAYVGAELNLPTTNQSIYLDGQPITSGSAKLADLGVKEGTLLAVLVLDESERTAAGATRQRTQGQAGGSGAAQRGGRARGQGQGRFQTEEHDLSRQEAVETLRQTLLNDPRKLEEVRTQAPELAKSVNNPALFEEHWMRRLQAEQAMQAEMVEQNRRLNNDPFDVEAQRRIEEIIRQERVMENLEHAMNYNPEVFGRVTMLYINTVVNGHPVKAFVDSGAQTTIMSPTCAEACGIMRLVDKRYAGIAKGVGTAKILGRVHSADLKIGTSTMACSFTVMEGKDVDLLLGLDMLKRYQANIDLRRNKLVFDEGNEVDFLPEAEIPKWSEEAQNDEPTIPGPDGTSIGAETGTVRPAPASSAAASSSSGSGNFRGEGQTVGSSSSTVPSASTAQPPAARAAAPIAPSRHSPADIDQLVSLGFSRAQAIDALDATGGNVEYAAGLLFQG